MCHTCHTRVTDKLLLCIDRPNSVLSSSHVIYRASVLSSEHLSPDEITHHIMDRVENYPHQHVNISGSLELVVLKRQCPVQLSLGRLPLCGPRVDDGPSSTPSNLPQTTGSPSFSASPAVSRPSSNSVESCVTVHILAAALAAELLLILALGLGAAVAVLAVQRRRLLKCVAPG